MPRLIKEVLGEPGWHWLDSRVGRPITGGQQSIRLFALRSDGTFIQSTAIPIKTELDMKQEGAVRQAIYEALKSLEEFRICQCKLGKACEKHE